MAATYKAAYPACGPAAWAATTRPAYRGGVSGPSYDADAQAYFTRAGVTDPVYMAEQNTLIAGLKSDLGATNFSDAFDAFWIFANQDDGGLAALYNAAKDAHHCTNVNSTSYVAGEGFTGNSSNMRLATDYAPVTDGVAWAQNSASFGSYQRLASRTNGRCALGGRDGSAVGVQFYVTFGAVSLIIINNGGSPTPANADHQGFFIISRTAAANYKLCRNGSVIATQASTSAAVSAPEQYILANNNNGTPADFYNNQIAVAFFGRGLSDAEVGLVNTRVEAYMDALGKGVQ